MCRLETLDPKHKELSFNCYDIVDETMNFINRLEILTDIRSKAPYDSKLQIVEHCYTKLEDIDAYHDKFISEGYEGAVIRDADMPYKSGGRDRRMQKLKRFSDLDAIITGISEGLRDEDFVFIMKLDNGIEFEAKPIGDRELKRWYRENLDNIIGEYGTVKYFNITPDGKPNLPVFLRVRDKKDM